MAQYSRSPMPSQSFQASAISKASISQAWTALQRAETWEGIAGVDSVSNAVHDSEGGLTRFDVGATVAGRRYPGEAIVTHTEEPHRMAVDVTTSDLLGIVEVSLTPHDEGTNVSINLTVGSRSFLAGMFFPKVAAAIGSGMHDTVAGFAEHLAR
jgi:uncharacterized protein YndB with AHSA1/START domain